MKYSLTHKQLQNLIKESELQSKYNGMTGHCEECAVAFNTVLKNVDKFVAIYDPYDDSRAVHAAIKIDDKYYDAKGKRTKDGIINHVSYLKPNDFNWCSTYEELYAWIEEDHYYEFNTNNENPFPKTHEPLIHDIEAHLKEIIESKKY